MFQIPSFGIPAPAMAEVLVRAGDSRDKYIATLSDTWKFQILPFDARAAIEAGELIASVKSCKEKWATWAKVKFDIQIVATAKAESASLIYSDDKDIENLAKRVNIKVVRICDLPLPTPPEPKAIEAGPVGTQMDLLVAEPKPTRVFRLDTNAEVKEDGKEQPKLKDHKLEADPAHPAPVQGSDSGRAQGETTSETLKEKI